MSVLLETSLGDLVLDLFVDKCPKTCQNFLKLCEMKYYNNCIFFDVQKDYLVQTGDPEATGQGGNSIFGVVSGDPQKRYFEDEIVKGIKVKRKGLVGMSNNGPNQNGSAFFITLTDNELENLYKKHTIFGQIAEGLEVLDKINKTYCDP